LTKIIGIGTDLVKHARILLMWERYADKFSKRILSQNELAVLAQHKKPSAYLAKRFAAKEAVVKALGTGFQHQVYLTHITIGNDAAGKPQVEFHKKTKDYIEQLGNLTFHLSISDELEYALAFVVIEKNI